MEGHHNLGLVTLSIAIAAMASYTALDLVESGGVVAKRWRVSGAVVMGTGIWSMHFVGMLAFELPVPMRYDLPLTLASLLIAVLTSGLVLWVSTQSRLSRIALLAGGAAMGAGISSMHYLGMAAMRMAPPINFDLLLVTGSVVVAIGASWVALWLAFALRLRVATSDFAVRAMAALVMGLAISGMHYIGMAAATFPPGSLCLAANLGPLSNLSPGELGWGIGALVSGLLGLALVLSASDLKRSRVSTAMLRRLEDANQALRLEVIERERAESEVRALQRFVQATLDSLDVNSHAKLSRFTAS